LNEQKEALHSHLDAITVQALKIQSQGASRDQETSLSSLSSDKAVEELRGLVLSLFAIGL